MRYSFIVIPILAILFVSVCGCEQELNLERYADTETERILVINSIMNPDSVMAVSVTHPYFFSRPHVSFSPVEDLDVTLCVDSGEWETLGYDRTAGLYISCRKPDAGDVIRLRVSGPAGTAVSSDTVPKRVSIEEVRATGEGPLHIYWDSDYRFTYRITFTDTPDKENYYFLAIENDARSYEFSQMGQMDYTADYVFHTLADMINSDIKGWKPDGVFGYPFSDKGIDGKRYTITVNEVLQTPLTWMIERLPRKINLYSISKAYFEYMVSVLSMDYDKSALKGNLLSLGLMEPTAIYSNIIGGTGLVGCYNLSTVHVDLLQLTGGWPSNHD